jgi:hypothetical protein
MEEVIFSVIGRTSAEQVKSLFIAVAVGTALVTVWALMNWEE